MRTVARRQPPTHEVAALLGAANLSAVALRRNATPPRSPAVYEMGAGGGRPFQQLLKQERFDLVLMGLWFWYDPQPSFAEMLVPLILSTAPPPADDDQQTEPDADGVDGAGRAERAGAADGPRRPSIALLHAPPMLAN